MSNLCWLARILVWQSLVIPSAIIQADYLLQAANPWWINILSKEIKPCYAELSADSLKIIIDSNDFKLWTSGSGMLCVPVSKVLSTPMLISIAGFHTALFNWIIKGPDGSVFWKMVMNLCSVMEPCDGYRRWDPISHCHLGLVSLTIFPSQFKLDGNFVSLSPRF